MGVSDQEGAAALNDVPNVFAKESRAMPARLAGGERRRRRSSGSDAEEPVLRGARSARLAVRLAIGMDPHLIEEWTRNQCEDRGEIRAMHACGDGARAESLSPTESASMEHKTKSVCE